MAKKKKKAARKTMGRATGTKTAKKSAARKKTAKKAASRAKGPLTKRNLGESWGAGDVRQLRQMIGENTPTRVIGLKLGRTEESVYSKASALGLSLKPTNQSPMG